MYATDRRHTDRRQRKASLNASALWHNTVAVYVTKLSFASERMQAAERAHNFVSSDDFNRRRGVAMSIIVSISAVQSHTPDVDADEMLNSRR